MTGVEAVRVMCTECNDTVDRLDVALGELTDVRLEALEVDVQLGQPTVAHAQLPMQRS